MMSLFVVLVSTSILPSIITIFSNLMSMYNVRRVSRKTSNYMTPCRRRTDDTRRVLLVITVECFFAIINSWFSDIVLSIIYCKKKLLADDDCPRFLEDNYHILVTFDMLNTLSNIVLHCVSGQHFRRELLSMYHSLFQVMKRILRYRCCSYGLIRHPRTDQEQRIYYHASISRTAHIDNAESSEIFLTIHPTSEPDRQSSFISRRIFRAFSSMLPPQQSLVIAKSTEDEDK